MLASRAGTVARRRTVAPSPTPALVQHKGANWASLASPQTLTFDSPISQGQLVVIYARSAEAFTGGTFITNYTDAVAMGTDSEVGQVLYQKYKIAGAVESNLVTFEDTDNIIIADVHGFVFSNIHQTVTLDKAPAPNDQTGTATSAVAPSTGTLSQAKEVAVAAVAHNAGHGGAGAAPAGFTIVDAALHTLAIFAYRITAETTALAPTFTWTTARHRITGISTYRGAA